MVKLALLFYFISSQAQVDAVTFVGAIGASANVAVSQMYSEASRHLHCYNFLYKSCEVKEVYDPESSLAGGPAGLFHC